VLVQGIVDVIGYVEGLNEAVQKDALDPSMKCLRHETQKVTAKIDDMLKRVEKEKLDVKLRDRRVKKQREEIGAATWNRVQSAEHAASVLMWQTSASADECMKLRHELAWTASSWAAERQAFAQYRKACEARESALQQQLSERDRLLAEYRSVAQQNQDKDRQVQQLQQILTEERAKHRADVIRLDLELRAERARLTGRKVEAAPDGLL
jgi:outer membrane protein TolC